VEQEKQKAQKRKTKALIVGKQPGSNTKSKQVTLGE